MAQSSMRPGTPATPGLPAQRITAIDVLRGVCILAIVPVNIQSFAMMDIAVQNPYAAPWTDRINLAAWLLTHVGIGFHPLAVFAMLFGAGIVLMDRHSRTLGLPSARVHYRRMVVLLLIGLMHAYGLWHGDILVIYALCGSVVYALRNLRPGRLLVCGAAVYCVALGVMLAMHYLLPHLPHDMTAGIYGSFQPGPEEIRAHDAAFRGGWWAQMSERIPSALASQTVLFAGILFWMCSGLMLMGMALLRWGVFSGQLPSRIYGWMIVIAGGIGWLIVLTGVQRNFAAGWDPTYSMLLGRLYNESATPILALVWIGATMLVCQSGRMPWLTGRLAAVGRMALSCYLMHTVVCSLIFYGSGLGLVHRVDRVGQFGITAMIWVAELWTCELWLRHFSFGPVEWIWRWLAYGLRPSWWQTPAGAQPPALALAGAPAVPRRSQVAEGITGPSTPQTMPARARADSAGRPAIERGDNQTNRQSCDKTAGAQSPRQAIDKSIAPDHGARGRSTWVKLLAFAGLVLAGHAVVAPLLLLSEFVGQWAALAVTLLATWLAVTWLEREALSSVGLGLSGRSAAEFIGGGLAGAALAGAAGLIYAGAGWASFALAEPRPAVLDVLEFTGLFLAAATYEELICRGYGFQLLARWNKAAAVLLSGAMFIAPHLHNAGATKPLVIINLALAHLVYAGLYFRTRSLWPLIGLHAAWNIAIALVLGLPMSGRRLAGRILDGLLQSGFWTANEFGPEGGAVVTGVFLVALVAVWLRRRPVASPTRTEGSSPPNP